MVDTNQVIAAIHPPQDRLQPESDDTLALGFSGEALLVFKWDSSSLGGIITCTEGHLAPLIANRIRDHH